MEKWDKIFTSGQPLSAAEMNEIVSKINALAEELGEGAVDIPQEQYMGFWDSTITYMRTRRTFPTVTHLGSKWYLVVSSDKGTEPMPMSNVWGLVAGSSELDIKFYNSSNFVVRINKVNTIVYMRLLLGDYDVSQNMLVRGEGTEYPTLVEWSRDSGDASADRTWTPTFVDDDGNIISPTSAKDKTNILLRFDGIQHFDLGFNWYTRRTCTFMAKIIMPDGYQLTKTLEVAL